MCRDHVKDYSHMNKVLMKGNCYHSPTIYEYIYMCVWGGWGGWGLISKRPFLSRNVNKALTLFKNGKLAYHRMKFDNERCPYRKRKVGSQIISCG